METRNRMKETEQKISMISFRPTLLESIKISFIGEAFDLNNCSVLRELLTGYWTLDDLYAIARNPNSEQYGAELPYLKSAYYPSKSIERIVKEGTRMYSKDMLGIIETEEETIWEFIPDNKTNKN